ncbi:hypothetical protein RRG08_024166 [Elysia crispata]|uniref:Uncharacterized protein n=1 Tax=Elysia crispata TaxID=231223 RepID=A0AAE0YQH1_9GAST|nr:hypothetical protein RRG08_024166 [Elysia crispata]
MCSSLGSVASSSRVGSVLHVGRDKQTGHCYVKLQCAANILGMNRVFRSSLTRDQLFIPTDKHQRDIKAQVTMDESTQTSTWLLNELLSKYIDDKEAKKQGRGLTAWKDLSPFHKSLRVVSLVARLVLLLGVLYCFICSLGLLEDSFKLLGGRAAGEAFRNSELLSNPVACLMIGVMATVLVQSSSTATSIVVAMVASQVLPLQSTIPIVMGTNVGTSITSTLVSLAQAGDRQEFRRAFSGATVHDMFNWCAVLVLLPLEVTTGYLYHFTGALVRLMKLEGENVKVELLTALTKPFTELIVQVNRDVITDIAMAPNVTQQSSVLRRWCEVVMTQFSVQVTRYRPLVIDCSSVAIESPFYSSCTQQGEADFIGSRHQSEQFFVGWNETEVINKTLRRHRCENLFAQTDLDDKTAGIILLILAIFVILASLFGVVKILNSLLKGPVAKAIQKTVNADLPGKLAYFTGYLAMLVGCGLTIVIQSSSVFTSTLTPLVGVGVVSVERMYPMTLGSNLGTTVTGMLAALSTRGGHLDQAMQIALVHLFFNISGVLLFFPVPVTRFPIDLAKTLGKVTARFRWFAGVYLAGMFLFLPGLVFALSMAGWPWLLGLGGLLLLLFLAVTIINVLQVKKPQWLPWKLRSWDFLPKFLHSLTPYDYVLSCACVRGKGHTSTAQAEETNPQDTNSEEMRDLLSETGTTIHGLSKNSNNFDYV